MQYSVTWKQITGHTEDRSERSFVPIHNTNLNSYTVYRVCKVNALLGDSVQMCFIVRTASQILGKSNNGGATQKCIRKVSC